MTSLLPNVNRRIARFVFPARRPRLATRSVSVACSHRITGFTSASLNASLAIVAWISSICPDGSRAKWLLLLVPVVGNALIFRATRIFYFLRYKRSAIGILVFLSVLRSCLKHFRFASRRGIPGILRRAFHDIALTDRFRPVSRSPRPD